MIQVKHIQLSVPLFIYMEYNMDQARFEKKNRKNGKTGIFPKRPTVANVDVVRKIHNNTILVNPPTQREILLAN